MATIQRRSALSKVYSRPKPQDQEEQKTKFRKRNVKKIGGRPAAQWEEHQDSITGFFYPLGREEVYNNKKKE